MIYKKSRYKEYRLACTEQVAQIVLIGILLMVWKLETTA